jgi:hypothetical protein
MLNKLFNKKNRSNRKAQFFVALDTWSLIIFVGLVILLFIIISITDDDVSDEINLNINGVNFAHYALNIFDNKNITLKNCINSPDNVSLKEMVIWFDYVHNNQPDDYDVCVQDLLDELVDFDGAELAGELAFDIILNDTFIVNSDKINNKQNFFLRYGYKSHNKLFVDQVKTDTDSMPAAFYFSLGEKLVLFKPASLIGQPNANKNLKHFIFDIPGENNNIRVVALFNPN